MGYTVYFAAKRRLDSDEATAIVHALRALVRRERATVRFEGPSNGTTIGFNGIDPHETFSVRFIKRGRSAELVPGFCKTARKPYDRIVKQALSLMQAITDNALEAECDDGVDYRFTARL